ncbi:MAG: DUF192 domain-containing protein [Longimicrobiales bacterium]|nr:DUF192 domain-containing protein [Longimicrobiales bacterium]
MPGQAVVTIGSRQWSVALATTLEEITQGLGGVEAIAPGTGMLFDVGQDQVIQVTTVPMLFDLDIVFIHSTQGVVGVARGVQPGLLVTSDGPARFFLEVNAGEAEGVQAGDSVLIEPLEAVAVEDGGVASIVNFGVAIGTLALAMGMLGTVVRAVMPRPRGEMLPATETIKYETWDYELTSPSHPTWRIRGRESSYRKAMDRVWRDRRSAEMHGISPIHTRVGKRGSSEDLGFRLLPETEMAHLPSPGVAVMPKLPPEARGDFLFFEDIRDLVRLGEKLTDEDVRRIWEARKKRPALAPAVIGPRERREVPEGLEYFADSAEQLLASTNPHRAQMDTAFREAIERVRAGREVPRTARGMSR